MKNILLHVEDEHLSLFDKAREIIKKQNGVEGRLSYISIVLTCVRAFVENYTEKK